VVKGGFIASARASWCSQDSLLEILAVRGDSGFGFALAVADSVRPVQHPAFPPSALVATRPLALAALRWVSDTAVRGFEVSAGNITVTEVTASGVSGTIDLQLKRIEAADTIRLTGKFTRIGIAAAEGACGRIQRVGGTR